MPLEGDDEKESRQIVSSRSSDLLRYQFIIWTKTRVVNGLTSFYNPFTRCHAKWHQSAQFFISHGIIFKWVSECVRARVFMKNSITLHAVDLCFLARKLKWSTQNKLTVWYNHSKRVLSKSTSNLILFFGRFGIFFLEKSRLQCLLCVFLEAIWSYM